MKTSELTEPINIVESESDIDIVPETQVDIQEPDIDFPEMQDLNIQNNDSFSDIKENLQIAQNEPQVIPRPKMQTEQMNPAQSNSNRQPITGAKFNTPQDRINDGIGSGNRLSGEGTKKPSHSFVTRSSDNKRLIDATPSWRAAYV